MNRWFSRKTAASLLIDHQDGVLQRVRNGLLKEEPLKVPMLAPGGEFASAAALGKIRGSAAANLETNVIADAGRWRELFPLARNQLSLVFRRVFASRPFGSSREAEPTRENAQGDENPLASADVLGRFFAAN